MRKASRAYVLYMLIYTLVDGIRRWVDGSSPVLLHVPDVQDHSQDLQQLTNDVRQQMQTLAPSLVQFWVTLRSDVLPSLRAATASSKNALLVLSLRLCAVYGETCNA